MNYFQGYNYVSLSTLHYLAMLDKFQVSCREMWIMEGVISDLNKFLCTTFNNYANYRPNSIQCDPGQIMTQSSKIEPKFCKR